jgi:hypothetical protein
MSQKSLPEFKQKQKLLHSPDSSPESLIAMGQEFFEAGWYIDAIDFWTQAKHEQGLRSMLVKAMEEGDVFLYTRCCKSLDQPAETEHWAQLAENALALGKLQFAREAFRLAGDRKNLDLVDAMVNPKKKTDEAEPQTVVE